MAAAPIVHGSEAEADAGFGGMVGETAADLAVVADADPGPAGNGDVQPGIDDRGVARHRQAGDPEGTAARLITHRRNRRFVPERMAPSRRGAQGRSEEHTSELQSLMRISYAVFCLKKK